MAVNNVGSIQSPVTSTEHASVTVKQSQQAAQEMRQVSALIAEKEKDRGVTVQKVENAVKKANNIAKVFYNRNLNFSVDKETEALVVKVIDADTKQVIRQIPPEDMLRFIEQFDRIRALLFSDNY